VVNNPGTFDLLLKDWRCFVLGKERERFLELCGLATNEQDPNRLLELVREINDILEAKEERLKQRKTPNPPGQ
jgi:hypothetical protein